MLLGKPQNFVIGVCQKPPSRWCVLHVTLATRGKRRIPDKKKWVTKKLEVGRRRGRSLVLTYYSTQLFRLQTGGAIAERKSVNATVRCDPWLTFVACENDGNPCRD